MLFCCKKCSKYWTCKRKWVRGEKGIAQTCCEECLFYKSCNEEITRGKGVDIGTAFIKSAQEVKGKVIVKSLRNAFSELEHTAFTKKLLDNSNIKYIVKEDKLYVVGDEALEFANIFKKETRRPLSKGIISATEEDALPMVELLIKSVVGESIYNGETIYYSIPSNPLDADFNIIYHERILNGFLKSLGYKPKPINEGEAVILSELANEGFSGLGLSFGAGMVNVCLSFMSVPMLNFSLTKAGDWIDQQVAIVVNETASRVSSIKESSFDLSKQEGWTKTEKVLSIYYTYLIEYVIENIKQEFSKQKVVPRLTKPISIVLSGGTSLSQGFADRFRQILEQLKFPVPVGEIKMASQPLKSVSKGALIAAIDEEERL